MSTAPAPAPTSTGLSQNVAGALAYALGPITGVIFYLLEKDNRFVRFHAVQSMLVGLVLFVFNIGLNVFNWFLERIPFIGWLMALGVGLVVGLVTFVLWLALMYRAYTGHEWQLPLVGTQARRIAGEGEGAVSVR